MLTFSDKPLPSLQRMGSKLRVNIKLGAKTTEEGVQEVYHSAHLPATGDTHSAVLQNARSLLEQVATQVIKKPVLVDGVEWKGGFESAQAINAVADMTELTGGTTVELYDVYQSGHIKTPTEAKQIAAQLGAVYQGHFRNRAAARKQLGAALDDESAITTVEQFVQETGYDYREME